MRKLWRLRGKPWPCAGSVESYVNLANYTLALQRLDETRQVIREAQARKLYDLILHNALYALAFLGADSAAMAEQQQWFAGKPDMRTLDLSIRHRGVWWESRW